MSYSFPAPSPSVPAPVLFAEQISDWEDFPDYEGSLGITRASMPQIKSSHRGALVRFLNSRGYAHSREDVNPRELLPAQKEYSPSKVERARNFEGPQRAIITSNDGYVADGHHQWLSQYDAETIPAMVIDCPITELLLQLSQFPSSETVEMTEPYLFYSEDQPRDEQGRFGSGGGGDSTPKGSQVKAVSLEPSSTNRLNIAYSGGQDRIFVDGTQKDSETDWINPATRLAVEATFDLNSADKSVYFNRIDALVSGKGYGREAAEHVMEKLATAGYKTMTAYVQFADSDSQSMMKKLGGTEGKETDHGRYWHFNLEGLRKASEPQQFAQDLSGWIWNPYTRSYIGATGEKVDTDKTRQLVARVRATISERLQTAAKRVQSGEETNLTQFSLDMKDDLKTVFLTTHVLARGGLDEMDQSSWGALGSALKDQYYYVDKLVRELENGETGVRDAETGQVLTRDSGIPELGDEFLDRVSLYTDSAWGAEGEFENVVRDREQDLGSLERRVLGDSKESCDSCVEQAEMGWQPPGVLLDIGDTECGLGCACRYEFENADLDEAARSLQGFNEPSIFYSEDQPRDDHGRFDGEGGAADLKDTEQEKTYTDTKGTDDAVNQKLVDDAGIKITVEDTLRKDTVEALAHVIAGDKTLTAEMKGMKVEVKDLGKRYGTMKDKLYLDKSTLKKEGPGFAATVIRHELEHAILTRAKVPSSEQESRVRYKTKIWANIKEASMAKTNPRAASGFKNAASLSH